jgi:hypothetical protein
MLDKKSENSIEVMIKSDLTMGRNQSTEKTKAGKRKR